MADNMMQTYNEKEQKRFAENLSAMFFQMWELEAKQRVVKQILRTLEGYLWARFNSEYDNLSETDKEYMYAELNKTYFPELTEEWDEEDYA